MSLAPLAEVDRKPATGEDGAEQPTSFRERKLSQLQSEVEPEPGKPNASAESEEDGYPDDDLETGSLDIEDTADVEDEVAEFDSDDELDDAEEVEDDEGEEEETVESLREKNLKLQQSLSRATENRKQIEGDFRDSIAENITYRHKLEDSVNEVQAQGGVLLAIANSQVAKFENMNWSQVPPENLQAYRAAAQKAVQNRDALMQKFGQVLDTAKREKETAKQREAEVSKNILARRIPEWGNDHFVKLREHAVSSLHYSPEEFNDLSDWRVVEMIHRDWERNQAVEKVQRVKRKRKAKTPRGRNARQQPRSAEGRFQNARDEAFANPGNKKSFRQMQMEKLKRERSQGVGR